jgi:hypothetical protein
VEPDAVGCDISMTPRPIEQDVAYAGPGHVSGLSCSPWSDRGDA